jgi:hypothetical protein
MRMEFQSSSPLSKLGIVRVVARGLVLMAGVCGGGSIGGCTATVQTAQPAEPAAATEDVVADTAPVDIQTYPHSDYNGRTVYFVNGRSYYSRGSRWYYYRTEPQDLAVRRRQYVQQAPAAHPRREEAPRGPEYREGPREAVPVH